MLRIECCITFTKVANYLFMKQKNFEKLSLKECLKELTVNELANNPRHCSKIVSQLQRYYTELDQKYSEELGDFHKELDALQQDMEDTSHEAIETLQRQLDAYESELKELNSKLKLKQTELDSKSTTIKDLIKDKKELKLNNTELSQIVAKLLTYCNKHGLSPQESNENTPSNTPSEANGVVNQENALK